MNKGLSKIFIIAIFALILLGCEAEAPHFFGIPDHTWWQLSQRQREVVSADMTGPNAKSVNKLCFSRCLQGCVPYDDSGSRGADPKCLGMCLKRCMPHSKFNAFYFNQKNQKFYPKLYDQYYEEHPNHLPLPRRARRRYYRSTAIKTKTRYAKAKVKPEAVTAKKTKKITSNTRHAKKKHIEKDRVLTLAVANKTSLKVGRHTLKPRQPVTVKPVKIEKEQTKEIKKSLSTKKITERSDALLPPLAPKVKEKS